MTLTTFIEEKRKEFDEAFLATMYKDDGYSEERETLKAFLESSLKELAHRMMEELPEEADMRPEIIVWLIKDRSFHEGWNNYRTGAIRKFKEFIGE